MKKKIPTRKIPSRPFPKREKEVSVEKHIFEGSREERLANLVKILDGKLKNLEVEGDMSG